MSKISVNEFFGPTFQGEGPDIGRPCFFLRLQGCPVQCPGCDTAYTWDGSERGTPMTIHELCEMMKDASARHPRCGLVLSGGEPLIHAANNDFFAVLAYNFFSKFPWKSLETSGYPIEVGKEPVGSFLQRFDTITWSPKITPCLQGKPNAEQILQFGQLISHFRLQSRTIVKVVVRDKADFEVVEWFEDRLNEATDYPINVMPYGLERDEIIAACEGLLPWCAERGYTLTPRLHSILWGSKRGV